jgi:acid ceramidase
MFQKRVLTLCLIICLGSIALANPRGSPFDETCETGKYPPDPSTVVPTYVVNLDLAPELRWKEITTKYAKPLTELIAYIKKFVLEFSPKFQSLINLIDNDLGPIADTLPTPYGAEIKGIAAAVGLPIGDVVFYNIFYEIFTLCTSIVAQNEKGDIFHARNLDFGLFLGWDLPNDTWIISELLRPMIVNVNFTRNNTVMYKSISFVGFVGLITAIKPGVMSYSMNERYGINGGYIGLFEWFLDINRNQAWTTLVARDVFETNGMDFEKAVQVLAGTPLLAPCYYIMAGPKPNQGAVITRDRKGAADVWRMGVNNTYWFLVETNYDHWKAPLFIDDRVTPANKCMNQTGQQGFSFSAMFNVLSTKPVLNKLTVYTALMELKTGRVETYVQTCPDPCWPF